MPPPNLLSMIRTVLLDLDGTLLDINMDAMLSEYFQRLSQHLAPLVPAQDVQQHVLAGTRAMVASRDPSRDLLTVFYEEFCRRTGCAGDAVYAAFDRFYVEHFPKLKRHGRPVAAAQSLVAWLFREGYEVVVATQPLFPLAAIRERLRWAGLEAYPYRLITTCELMHASKPALAYYREILSLVGRAPQECLMVGNDAETDLPARRAGIKTYFLVEPRPRRIDQADYCGDLAGVKSALLLDQKGC